MDYKQEILKVTLEYVKAELSESEAGHDWWHAVRVKNTAVKIAETECCNRFIVEMSALLHDIADAKFHNGDENIAASKALLFLDGLGIPKEETEHIINIINNISFKGGNTIQNFSSIELSIVQDADRLDAIGAIGIARAFSYGGYKKREFYNPDVAPVLNMNPKQYRSSNSPTINHFYEKLLLLQDRMNTKSGKILAKERHDFMVLFLNQFYREWNGD
jgi:uncharacterized protein